MINKILTLYNRSDRLMVFSFNLIKRLSMFSRLKWTEGRQNNHYYKSLIFSSDFFNFDVYLLKFPKGSFIDYHKDPVKYGYEHHRINFVLNDDFKGGKFVIKGRARKGRIHIFRPDMYKHKVTEVKEGIRYVLSIGWLRKIKED